LKVPSAVVFSVHKFDLLMSGSDSKGNVDGGGGDGKPHNVNDELDPYFVRVRAASLVKARDSCRAYAADLKSWGGDNAEAIANAEAGAASADKALAETVARLHELEAALFPDKSG
jgi:hypothetical protein